jgi:hypothetical protein
MNDKILIWLDDVRDPISNPDWLAFSPIEQPFRVFWIKNYNDFVNFITAKGLPDAICFDHDLSDFQAFYNGYPEKLEQALKDAEEVGRLDKWTETLANEKTGMDCVKWLCEYCLDNNKELPLYNIQSANPVGKENMRSYLEQFKKHL